MEMVGAGAKWIVWKRRESGVRGVERWWGGGGGRMKGCVPGGERVALRSLGCSDEGVAGGAVVMVACDQNCIDE